MIKINRFLKYLCDRFLMQFYIFWWTYKEIVIILAQIPDKYFTCKKQNNTKRLLMITFVDVAAMIEVH